MGTKDNDEILQQIYVSQKMGNIQYMLAILDIQAMNHFESYTNGLLEPESPNFDPNHMFLSIIEDEMSAEKSGHFGICLLRHLINISMWLPFQN